MLVSYNWLKEEYFDGDLDTPEVLEELLTTRAFEVESLEKVGDDTAIDVDVLPNRSHDCLSHEGIAKEIAVLQGIKISTREHKDTPIDESLTGELKVSLDEPVRCPRYSGRIISGITVKESPEWLKKRLETLGQRSINNIVDITNFVMLSIGQPLHAFDHKKVEGSQIIVRLAKEGEHITTLDNKEVDLDTETLVIADKEDPLAIAGIKGGKKAEVEDSTSDIVLEAANFKSVTTRKTAGRIGIATDSSKRYENEISSSLVVRGMEMATALILELAGGSNTKVGEVVDMYPRPVQPYKVGVSVSEVNSLLGTSLSRGDIGEVFDRLAFDYEVVMPQDQIMQIATKLTGKPYKYGASVSLDAPDLFDCSSFTAYVFAQAGIGIPRITVDQYVYGVEVAPEDIMSGDIVFAQNGSDGEEHAYVRTSDGKEIMQKVSHTESVEFLPGTKVPKGIDHCGIYLGEGKIAHASGKWYKGEVVIEDMEESPAFSEVRGVRRILKDEERFVITSPSERLDLRTKQDLIEEIGRVYGYDKIDSVVFDLNESAPINKTFYYTNSVRNYLVSKGLSDTYTHAFVAEGEIEIINPVGSNRPFVRQDLATSLIEAMDRNIKNVDLLGLQRLGIFEIGKVFQKKGEFVSFAIALQDSNKKKNNKEVPVAMERLVVEVLENIGYKIDDIKKIKDIDGRIRQNNTPTPNTWVFECNFEKLVGFLPEPAELLSNVLLLQEDSISYSTFSSYPFISRDIAIFVSGDTESDNVKDVLVQNAGKLLMREPQLFDTFTKTDDNGNERVSYAFKMVFQADDRTLTDDEINTIMDGVYKEIENKGWEVR